MNGAQERKLRVYPDTLSIIISTGRECDLYIERHFGEVLEMVPRRTGSNYVEVPESVLSPLLEEADRVLNSAADDTKRRRACQRIATELRSATFPYITATETVHV